MNKGWKCPICGFVYAPFVSRCSECPRNSTGNVAVSPNCFCPTNTTGQQLHTAYCQRPIIDIALAQHGGSTP